MRRLLLSCTLVFGLTLISSALAQEVDRDALFSEGNELYEAGDYESARSAYEKLAESGELSAVLFFNLGNTAFRLQDAGSAGLWYRRALQLNPQMTEAAQNLRLIKQQQGYQSFNDGQLDGLASRYTVEQWRVILAISIWLTVLSVAFLLTFRGRLVQAICWPVLGLSLVVIVVSATGVVVYVNNVNPEQVAVVLEAEAEAVNGPFPEAKGIITLPAGSEVRIRRERDAWTFIETPGQTAGWVRSNLIAPVKTW